MTSGEEKQTSKGPWFWVLLIGGIGCFIVVVIVGILAALLIPALSDVRRTAKATDCKNNLKQLSIYLMTYTARYGGDRDYPPAPPYGFHETLWSVPETGGAVASRPGDNSLFLCKSYAGASRRSNAALDYTSPDLTNTRLFPGGRLTDRVHFATMISGDIAEEDTPNHGGSAGAPTFRYNVMRFDGSVGAVEPGSPDEREYFDSTTGKRVP